MLPNSQADLPFQFTIPQNAKNSPKPMIYSPFWFAILKHISESCNTIPNITYTSRNVEPNSMPNTFKVQLSWLIK